MKIIKMKSIFIYKQLQLYGGFMFIFISVFHILMVLCFILYLIYSRCTSTVRKGGKDMFYNIAALTIKLTLTK